MEKSNKGKVEWRFSGSEAASEAWAASLGTVVSSIRARTNPNGDKRVLPPSEVSKTWPEAEASIAHVIDSGTGNAYAPSIGTPHAKKAVSDLLNRDLEGQDFKLKPEDVFMAAGCKQSIDIIVEILSKPNANILFPQPGFPRYDVRALYSRIEFRKYNVLPDQNYEIDLDHVEKLADDNTFAIGIINPHNPCCNVYSEEHLKKLAELARKLGIMVISDEVYRWTVFGDRPFVPMAKFASIAPVITLGSLSKGWGVPGWRMGWIALNDPEGVLKSTKVVQAIKEYLEISSKPATIFQAALSDIFEKTPAEFFEKKNAYLRKNAEYGFNQLKDIPCLHCPMKPEACTFLWAKLELSQLEDIKDDHEFCSKLAAEENLIVVPGSALGLENWLRISIEYSDASLVEQTFERLKGFFKRHANI
ncbi:PREDICTED: probable aminotransferase TAT4 [Tarenaya hassleriana]|uniref:probable aminotransferase TAT4 n=1 Tax=Tarenaya hassleriana TaxID=28532 RepID=UPI00053C5DA8|nr:PREDICTED: probable aminotransferase TAT4 [Tarenaya hassleriana]